MIDLHYSATPNGQKIAIMLEEIGAPYRVIPYDIFDGDQLTAEFGRINPNHKLPAIVDRDPAEGGDPVTVFESGAILQYLAEKSGRFLPASGSARAATLSWLTWQVAGLGPMGGQASHFLRYAPAGQDYAIGRYTKELNRLLTVLEKRLEKSAYVAGLRLGLGARLAVGVDESDAHQFTSCNRTASLIAFRPSRSSCSLV